jgi:Skp family chaperone for outer membrane proteins
MNNMYCVDFEYIIFRYKSYIDQMSELEQYKISHYDEMDSIKKEMELIVNSSKSGLILDETVQKKNIIRFKELQQTAMNKEQDFRSDIQEKQSLVMDRCFLEISEIIEKYSKSCGIYMVFNKANVLYTSPECDITEYILNMLREKDLFVELEETENIEQ